MTKQNFVKFDLTCWYLNARRIIELTDLHPFNFRGNTDDQLQKLYQQKLLKDSLLIWIKNHKPSPLIKMITENKLKEGNSFTYNSDFYFKGLGKVWTAIQNKKEYELAAAYSKIESWKKGGKICFDLHHEHLTSNSSWCELTKRTRVFIFGVITQIRKMEIICKPYVIANIINHEGLLHNNRLHIQNHLEVTVDSIDNFKRIRKYSPKYSKKSLQILKNIPEKKIKEVFADIIGEPTIPKDWGGEKSDLISDNIKIDGRNCITALAFKGPSKFKPMTLADLGKNGDQINRLFSESADFFILQHCHEITPAVRENMRAWAQQNFFAPKLFCIINGYSTLRILEAYKKFGLKKQLK